MRAGQMAIGGAALVVVAGAIAGVVLMRGTNTPVPTSERSGEVTAGTPVISVTTSEARITAALAALAAAGPARSHHRESARILPAMPPLPFSHPARRHRNAAWLGPWPRPLWHHRTPGGASRKALPIPTRCAQAGAKGVVWTVENILRYSLQPQTLPA